MTVDAALIDRELLAGNRALPNLVVALALPNECAPVPQQDLSEFAIKRSGHSGRQRDGRANIAVDAQALRRRGLMVLG